MRIMRLVLENRRRLGTVITEKIVEMTAIRFGQEVLMLLLEQRGADVVITEEG